MTARWFAATSSPSFLRAPRLFSTQVNIHHDGRHRLSRIWVPAAALAPVKHDDLDVHARLIRSGFLRQAHSGFYHMLPLGHRVQRKVERLVDMHMEQLGASRIDLSTLSAESLWEKTGRISDLGPELFRLQDRKGSPYLLAPTHEEEVTTLVAKGLRSYKELPLRLYQITRKYRDEMRPRAGLLRAREFVMKDLYTFDFSVDAALEAYRSTRECYSRLFAHLKLPVIAAEATSGDMGGSLSHEYLLPTPTGEDELITCENCGYSANSEVMASKPSQVDPSILGSTTSFRVWRGISLDRRTLVNAWYPDTETTHLDIKRLKAMLPGLDTGLADVTTHWRESVSGSARGRLQLINFVDYRLSPRFLDSLERSDDSVPIWPASIYPRDPTSVEISTVSRSSNDNGPLDLVRPASGDACPECRTGTIDVRSAIELGHTFHLGTRYSEPLGATVTVPASFVGGTDVKAGSTTSLPLQMGCHGIGITRLVAAIAKHCSGDRGLAWPRSIAPFEIAVLHNPEVEGDAVQLYNTLCSLNVEDVVLDDRPNSLPWKMKDADEAGFPIKIVMGKHWKTEKKVEVQCTSLGLKVLVDQIEVRQKVEEILLAL